LYVPNSSKLPVRLRRTL